MMDNLDFSEEEIQEQLTALGYKNIPRHRLCEFKQDLDELVRRGEWRCFASPAQINAAASRPSPPAFTKEKVGRCCFESSAEGFFFHAREVDLDRPVLTACQNRDNERRQQGRRDSYARHSVALNLRLPPGAPSRLQVEEEEEEAGPEESLRPPLTDSCTSTPDSHRGRFTKRKVLRKHKGQSLVCDESVYSEDGEEVEISEENANAVGVSGDSYREAPGEEEVKEEEERGIRGEDSKPVTDAEDSLLEASGKEEEDKSNPLSESGDSDQEASEEIERVVSEQESKPVGDADDRLQEEEEEEEVEEEEDSNPLSDSEESYQEEEEMERVISEQESKPDGDADDHLQEEEEEEVEEEDSNPLSDSEESYQEDSEEEEVERVISEEESKPVGGAEDVLTESLEEEDSNPLSDSEESYQEEEEMERVISEEESKPDADDPLEEEEDSNPPGDSEDRHQEASEEEKPELDNRVGLEGGDDDDDEEERCSSSDSPAPSLMTSGYGTYKAEELEGGGRDSRGDLSEGRDDEEDDDGSLSGFGWFDLKPAEPDPAEARPASVLSAGEPGPEEDRDREEEEEPEVDLREATLEERRVCNAVGEEKVDMKDSAGGSEEEEEEEQEEQEQEEQQLGEEVESSSNKDIKFIDSNAEFSQMAFDRMCADWEGNLRKEKKTEKKEKKEKKKMTKEKKTKKKKTTGASSLEEQLAGLHLSSSARFETENEEDDDDDESAGTDGVSFSAFESYMRGMTRTQSDGDLRPKTKSFIRPAISQQTIKKTDPVAKYFKYKQLWEMFQLPGEKDRRSLRWEIQERLAYRPPPAKPRRVFVPNGYIVPTDKKRSALRWEVRNDLANRLLPHKSSSQ
ncbi:trichohyalin isoform X2 [Cyclopterus lumpus]|uniref:trichohyalin isoform X2 n=1 Tax=Cyclopterus lumpus TaxID=8103 RepID=UPI0014867A40|nr:trichohyalin isoform X2 [Cyclopterus lumpus]